MIINENISYCKPDFVSQKFHFNIMDSPLYASILLTYSCNFSCKFCCNSDLLKQHKIIKIDEFKKLIEQINYTLINQITLTGGEVSLIDNLDEYLKICKDNGLKTSIITNGNVYGKDIKKYKKIEPYLDSIYISLHGPEEIHNSITGTQSFSNVINLIKYISKTDNTPNLLYTASKLNYSSEALQEVIKIAQKYNATLNIARTNNLGAGKDQMLSINDIWEIFEIIDKYQKSGVNVLFINAIPLCIIKPEYHKYVSNCSCGMGNVVILPNGNLGFCNEKDIKIGNINKKPITKIWKGRKHIKELKERSENILQICCNCPYLISCKTACKYETEEGYDYYLIQAINLKWDKIKNKKLKLKYTSTITFPNNHSYFIYQYVARVFSQETLLLLKQFEKGNMPQAVLNNQELTKKTELNYKYIITDFYEIGGFDEISEDR